VRQIIEPKIIGNKVGLNALVTLMAMVIGLKLFGAFGLLACLWRLRSSTAWNTRASSIFSAKKTRRDRYAGRPDHANAVKTTINRR
jgi:hypothetical protein